MVSVFYPYWWLKLSGYVGVGVNTYWNNPDIIEFEPEPVSTAHSPLLLVIMTAMISVAIGFVLGRNKAMSREGEMPLWAKTVRDQRAYQVLCHFNVKLRLHKTIYSLPRIESVGNS